MTFVNYVKHTHIYALIEHRVWVFSRVLVAFDV